MLSKEASIKITEIPKGWTVEAADFVNKVCILIQYIFYMNLINKINKIYLAIKKISK